MLSSFYDSVRVGSLIDPQRLAERLRLPMTGLARLAKVNRNTMATNAASEKVQGKLQDITKILARATELSGEEDRAIIWFKYVKITGFGKTAEELVEEGHGEAVLWHLDGLEAGVYA